MFLSFQFFSKIKPLSNVAFSFKIWFFSNLVGEEGPRIPGVKDSRVCF